MLEVVVAHTGELPRALLDASHELLITTFDDLTDADWEHCLGGMHAVAVQDGAVVGHASLVQRRLLLGGRAVRTGYVEGVAVRADVRRTGVGAAVMTPLERIARAAHELAALGSTEAGLPFYLARGWQRWRGPTAALTLRGVVRTPDEDGWILVLPCAVSPNLDAELVCDHRDGDAW